ncbi:GroES-like protein [Nemania sp. FL0916]|nr:GroES-like protein [Nemania sp. FL0916]
MALVNKAAFYPSNKAPTLTVSETSYPTARAGEVIIKVHAAGIGPIDHKIQDLGTDILPFLTYPLVGGIDVAGTIVSCGNGTTGTTETNFNPGERVLAFVPEFSSRAGAFQNYVAAPASLVVRIPDTLTFEEAVVLPSGVATGTVALYRFLGLNLPTTPTTTPVQGRDKNEGEERQVVLITAGASSVGSNAIQLAAASGYDVFTTASRRHFAHCRALGASKVFDYQAADVASTILTALKGRQCAGAVSCVEGSNALAFDVIRACEGEKAVACSILFDAESVPAEIKAEMIHAHWIRDTPLAETIFGSYLPGALAGGGYKCEPRPRVVGHGLEAVQTALDIGKGNGVSCEKLVVTLA